MDSPAEPDLPDFMYQMALLFGAVELRNAAGDIDSAMALMKLACDRLNERAEWDEEFRYAMIDDAKLDGKIPLEWGWGELPGGFEES